MDVAADIGRRDNPRMGEPFVQANVPALNSSGDLVECERSSSLPELTDFTAGNLAVMAYIGMASGLIWFRLVTDGDGVPRNRRLTRYIEQVDDSYRALSRR